MYNKHQEICRFFLLSCFQFLLQPEEISGDFDTIIITHNLSQTKVTYSLRVSPLLKEKLCVRLCCGYTEYSIFWPKC